MKAKHRYAQGLGVMALTMVVTFTTGCAREEYKMQTSVGDIGDAMEHCRGFMYFLTEQGTQVSIDNLSSRETSEHYDIFLDLSDSKQSGYAQCRVDMQGKIIYHVMRNFRRKSRSFS